MNFIFLGGIPPKTNSKVGHFELALVLKRNRMCFFKLRANGDGDGAKMVQVAEEPAADVPVMFTYSANYLVSLSVTATFPEAQPLKFSNPF